jgi:hypothetical protein
MLSKSYPFNKYPLEISVYKYPFTIKNLQLTLQRSIISISFGIYLYLLHTHTHTYMHMYIHALTYTYIIIINVLEECRT